MRVPTLPCLALAMTLPAAFLAAAPLPLIPLPQKVEATGSPFSLTKETVIQADQALAGEANLLATAIGARSGTAPKVVAGSGDAAAACIRLTVDPKLPLKAEGYAFESSPAGVLIKGKDAAGAFYGTQTLLQLLPPAGAEAWAAPVPVPGTRILDQPRFGWRGMHLDVGRHLFEVKDIKSFLDWMAFHKLNSFHWHLTEDQGWRLEIKKYPKLTEVGAWRASSPPYGNRNGSDGTRYGGFYTQDQAREIVAYAAARHITVVPEIEMPGHAAGAITAYPNLGNDDIPNYAPAVVTQWGVFPYIFAPKEETFRFLDDVLTEVCALFPSKIIHIGGDEAPKDQWKQSKFAQEVIKREGLKNEEELQSWFIRRIEKMLAAKGRRLIGWDEIQEGGLPKTAAMMVWRGETWARHALDRGNEVVMAPNSFLYLDYYQGPKEQELAKGIEYEAIGGYVPIDKVYSYDPGAVAKDAEQARRILGVQAQLWAEYFKTWDKVTYHAVPRMLAVAEVAWTPLEKKDYAGFLQRLDPLLAHYDAAKVKHGSLPPPPPKRETKDGATIETTLPTYENHWPELAYDGRDDTFFWCGRALLAGDHFSLRLKAPAGGQSIEVATGGSASRNGDKLGAGVLEASTDGIGWTEVAKFADGRAAGTLPEGATRIRIRVTAAQEFWLILNEIRIAAKPTTRRTETKTVPVPGGGQVEVTLDVDWSEAPDLAKEADHLATCFFTHYQAISELLGHAPGRPKTTVGLMLRPANVPGYTSGGRITISSDHLRRNNLEEAEGVMVHELAHAIQAYPPGAPGWLVEGIADWVRFKRMPDSRWRRVNEAHTNKKTPFAAYWNSTAFLLWVEKSHPGIVPELSKACRQRGWQDGIWQQLAGKPVAQLAEEYAAS